MENPNAGGVRLQKHHSMHSTLRRRPSILNTQLPMKSNPYVGSFRHAPPAPLPPSSKAETPSKNMKSANSIIPKLSVPVTLPMKSSPYIGWFRHAPPCSFSCRDEMKRHYLMQRLEDRYAKLINSLPLPRRNDLKIADLLLSGHLKGGGKEETKDIFRQQQQHLHQHQQIWLESAAHGFFYAFRIVARLASGFAYDAESMKYITDARASHHTSSSYQDGRDKQRRAKSRPGHHEPFADDDDDDDDDSQSSEDSSCDDDDANSSVTSSLSIPGVLDLPADLDLSSIDIPTDLELSVSSLAEAYYAHQAAKDLDLMSHCSYLGNDQTAGLQFGHHRLDYVITQLDIARMARNASRHLDVESIYNLPTTTYHVKKQRGLTPVPCAPPPPQQHILGNDATEGFSWLIIPAEPKSEGSVEDTSNHSTAKHPHLEQHDEKDDDEEEVCVICFEHFSEGDRLRVLPCQHSFHMGCIDRWLSGSHSSLDCVTSGCPTCKKRPSVGGDPLDDEHAALNGSVPAWAFAQIGESLAAVAGHGMHSATTATH